MAWQRRATEPSSSASDTSYNSDRGFARVVWAELPMHIQLCEIAHGRRVPCDAESVSLVRTFVFVVVVNTAPSFPVYSWSFRQSLVSRAAGVPPSPMRRRVNA